MTTYETSLVYILREADGSLRVVHDRMTLGIFPRVTWNRLLAEAGFGQVMIAAVSGRDVFQATGQPGPVEQGATSATPSLRY